MSQLSVGLGERSYPILIEGGLLYTVGSHIAAQNIANRYCVIADENVAELYADTLLGALSRSNIEAQLVCFPPGEASKNLSTFARLCSSLAQNKFDRKDGVIALGGGVVGDIAGFVAASYMRGIPFIQIPTTLLSQVDSSVGGKTGVDIPEGKNLVGAFYQPKAVYIDTDVLRTLPQKEFIGGLAEVIKYGVIRDPAFFSYLCDVREKALALDSLVIEKIVHNCCAIKAEVVAEDEQESDVRRILNYGHTIGHAVEAASDFSIIHGEAVAIGMAVISRIANHIGLLSDADKNEIIALLNQYKLPTEIPAELDTAAIQKYLLTDKKVESGKIVYVLPLKIGEVTIRADVAEKTVAEALSGKIK